MQIESSQKLIRIVGLSATLPNYLDVALFLRVNPRIGLYHFDSRFRPVPLGQTFVGVKAIGIMDQMRQMDNACYEKVHEMVSKGHQVRNKYIKGSAKNQGVGIKSINEYIMMICLGHGVCARA